MASAQIENHGWRVTLAGTGINLALGVLYAWSVMKAAIPKSWNWSEADKTLPYSIACLIFSLAMIPAGRLQDRVGPRWVATFGGLLIGLGCIVSGLVGSSSMGFVIGFGVLAGIGIGFGYASATPPAVKWFPPAKTGMIAGLVVAGFGLASVYVAPLATYLLKKFAVNNEMGVSNTMLVLGIAFLAVVVVLAQLLKNPPAGYVPAGSAPAPGKAAAAKPADVSWPAMLKTAQFWVLWLMYFFGAGVGLMLISIAQPLGKKALGEKAFFAVVVLAIGNAGGRILAGTISDKIGRQWTMFLVYALQAVVAILLLSIQGNRELLLTVLLVAGANYGANLALFPAITKDYFGLKGFGLNYGILFTAWGFGGLCLSYVCARVQDAYKTPNPAFKLACGMLIVAALLTFVSRSIAAKAASAKARRVQCKKCDHENVLEAAACARCGEALAGAV
jgi:MFS transporter, OFA family, oxalate/formate antiporter